MITKTRYVLAVHDLKVSAEYYENQLGFKTNWAGEGWHFLSRDACFVMLGECKDAIDPQALGDHQYFAYLEVDNVDDLFEEFSNKEVHIRTKPKTQPWGQREFAIQTIDGHRIMIGQEIP